MNEVLNVFNHLSFFIDETINIRKKRTINLCCHVPPSVTLKEDSFQLKVVANVAESMTAVVQVKWLINELKEIINNQLDRVNCIDTNICATMKTMWAKIAQFSKMKHIFFVSCDNHNLQLLLENIIKKSFFANVVEKTQSIMINFRSFFKELAILWFYQMKASHATIEFDWIKINSISDLRSTTFVNPQRFD